MALDVVALRTAIARIAAGLERDHAQLTALDAQLGDGDLGITLLKAFRALEAAAPGLPADLGAALLQMGSATAKVSSSSFGTLMATAFIAASKQLKGSETAAWSELPDLLEAARAAMQARGKASLGDKTVLDALAAIEAAIAGTADPAAQLSAARRAIDAALAEFRQKPNRIGRARVYAERSIGLDDPGMMAVKVMLSAL